MIIIRLQASDDFTFDLFINVEFTFRISRSYQMKVCSKLIFFLFVTSNERNSSCAQCCSYNVRLSLHLNTFFKIVLSVERRRAVDQSYKMLNVKDTTFKFQMEFYSKKFHRHQLDKIWNEPNQWPLLWHSLVISLIAFPLLSASTSKGRSAGTSVYCSTSIPLSLTTVKCWERWINTLKNSIWP